VLDFGPSKDSAQSLTENLFDQMEKNFPDLRSISLERISSVDEKIFQNLTKLKKVSVRSSPVVSKLLENLFKPLLELEQLELYDNSKLVELPGESNSLYAVPY